MDHSAAYLGTTNTSTITSTSMSSTSITSPEPSSSSSSSRKRPAPSPDQQTNQRRTRGAYTPMACDGCKKRKLKCIPVEARESCERCFTKGLACQYTQAHGPSTIVTKSKAESRQCHTSKNDLIQLRQDLNSLTDYVKMLGTRVGCPPHPFPQDAAPEKPVPNQPQFVAPTMPAAYGFALSNMGVPSGERPASSHSHSHSHSHSQSPAPESPEATTRKDVDFWKTCTVDEVTRILRVFKEEVDGAYPFIDTEDLIEQASDILDIIREEEGARLTSSLQKREGPSKKFDYRDVEIMKVAVCLGFNLEANGRTEMSDKTIKSIEKNVIQIAGPEVDLKHVQLLTLLSYFYFHSDGELMAWRTIGAAARAALEMGLHRKQSLDEMFKDPATRQLAIKVFWCVYLLDRRLSFGIGLSWAFQEDDIDPELPKPEPAGSFLNCVIGYAVLSTSIWKAIPPFRPPSTPIPRDTVEHLERKIQDWIETIPPHLKLQYPQQRMSPEIDSLHRSRALFYVRGNHTRILLYRHHLFSAEGIAANLSDAKLVVDIAKDSVEVLVQLNATAGLYSRQQMTFNYFLVLALSAIFLAVCHAPKIFWEPCKKSFTDAVELIRGLSGQNSRRLWNSIRDVLPQLKRLNLPGSAPPPNMANASGKGKKMMTTMMTTTTPLEKAHENHATSFSDRNMDMPSLVGDNVPVASVLPNGISYDNSFDYSIPGFTQIGDNLMNLYDSFGQWDKYQELDSSGQMRNNWDSNGNMLFLGFM